MANLRWHTCRARSASQESTDQSEDYYAISTTRTKKIVPSQRLLTISNEAFGNQCSFPVCYLYISIHHHFQILLQFPFGERAFFLESQHAITELPSPPSDASSNPSQRPNPKSCLSFLSFKTPCTTITQTPANMSPTHERNLNFHTETAQDQSRNSSINHRSCSID